MNVRVPIFITVCLSFLGAGTIPADELESLVESAYVHSPALQAAEAGTRQAAAAREASDEFLDPATTAAAGRLSGTAATPLLGAPIGLPAADAYGASGAVEVPVQPGVYAGIGVSQQYRSDPSYGLNSGYQTLVGAQLRIPLLQDRGFSLWKQDQARLTELRTAAEGHQREVRQTVRHAVEQTYIAYLEQVANAATSFSAMERARQLLTDAEELVRLKVVPEYQLAPARLEVALRREEICAASQAIDTARLRLEQVIGIPVGTLTTNSAVLVERVRQAQLPGLPETDPSFGARGAHREIAALAAAAVAETRSLDNRLRPDLSLAVRGVWAADDTSAQDNAGVVSGEASSTAAMLVWTRPWNQTGARARLRGAQARVAQLADLRRDLQIKLKADLAASRREFTGAR